MRSAALPSFLPSRHGFRFANRWPAAPAFDWNAGYVRVGVGNVADGLCGGMCFAVADRYLRGEPPPPDTVAPDPGAPLFREIASRQVDSFHWLVGVPFRFWWTSVRLRGGRWAARDQVREWRAIRAEIDAGRPAMLGLVRAASGSPFSLNVHHQVLAFAYEAGPAEATIRIYDPNHPGRDDVAIELRVSGRSVSLAQTTGEPLLALLRLPYRPARVPARVPAPAPPRPPERVPER